MGMSPESRYEHNLKVLRRRDPSITSIFDQFSHVCVYHHNGEKWEKHGYEGSMFLFERAAFPPYGFYILNRMGMEDYVQRLYPEDDIGAHGSYLMLRSYPEFTKRRLEELPKGHDKFSDVYKFDKEAYKPQQKGETQIIGLWMFATDAREPMIDVMIRCVVPSFLSEFIDEHTTFDSLHSFIQRNVPYPDEYRYGPDRPPPPNPHLRTINNVPGRTASAASTSTTTASSSSSLVNGGGGGDLAMLLAKLSSAPSTSSLVTGTQTATRPKPETKLSVDDLFASLKGQTPVQTPGELSTNGTIAPPAPSTGIALLDSIFASAAPSNPAFPPSSSSQADMAQIAAALTKPQPQQTSQSHARTSSTTSTSTTSSRSMALQGQSQTQRASPQRSASKPNGILTLTQAVVEGLLDGSGVGKGAFTGIAGVEAVGTNGKGSHSHAPNGHSFVSSLSEDDKKSEDDGEEEILELDFADTRALSDMSEFKSREKEREKKKIEGKESPTNTIQAPKEAAPAVAISSPALDMLFSRTSRPAEPVNVTKVNGIAAHDAPVVKQENVVKESLLDALFVNAARNCPESGEEIGAIQSKTDLVKEVERLLRQDEHFVDALWEAFEGRERVNPGGSVGSSQRKRNRRRQGRNGVASNEMEAA
ncbi:hypothetical protein PQX77_016931 [Marasmius sp. AFHP31]|nr:hypothetical protein PQX77_016931 [Marasmius sp. AFHP31]